MRKIVYVANIRIPTEKAHGIQIMKTCEAFAKEGIDVELVVPTRRNHIKENPFDYYRVEQLFEINKLFSLDLASLGKLGFLVQSLTFSISVLWRFCGIKNKEETVFYSRDEMSVWLLSLLGKKVVWEAHMGHDNFFIRRIISRNIPIVTISRGLVELYRSCGAKTTLVSPDGVDLKQFQVEESREEARGKLGLPKDVSLVVYTGHLYSWKGADILAEASSKLGDNTLVVFVGGTEKDVITFKNKYGYLKNIMILGSKPHHEIPLYLRAADVLVIPNSAKEKISRLYTSPMKLFEYMASGTPIVVADLPSMREILNEKNSVLVLPDNIEDFARGLKIVLADRVGSTILAKRALFDVEQYSWNKRAERIVSFIFSH